MVGFIFDRLAKWLVCTITGWLNGWLVGLMIGWINDWLD